MTARRHRSLVIALVLALAAQFAYAAPATATSMVRALTCCAAHGHPVVPARSSRCCHVFRQAEDPALRPSAHAQASGGAPVAIVAAPVAPAPLAAAPSHDLVGRYPSGPPLYLQILTLRL